MHYTSLLGLLKEFQGKNLQNFVPLVCSLLHPVRVCSVFFSSFLTPLNIYQSYCDTYIYTYTTPSIFLSPCCKSYFPHELTTAGVSFCF